MQWTQKREKYCKLFSRECEKWKSLSCVRLFETPWIIQSMEFSRPEYWSGYPFPSPRHLPNLGVEPRSPALLEDSLPAKPQGKLKNTAVGSLFLPQGIFPTQESNQVLLHCRQILYQLNFQGSPRNVNLVFNIIFTELTFSYMLIYVLWADTFTGDWLVT